MIAKKIEQNVAQSRVARNGALHHGNAQTSSTLKSNPFKLRPRQLILELKRLRAENEHLRRENMVLRGEVTRLRLYSEMEIASGSRTIPDTVPDNARKFYHILPAAFEQVDFFRMASDLGFSVESTQHIMGIFLRERLLIHGDRTGFEKADLYQYELPLS